MAQKHALKEEGHPDLHIDVDSVLKRKGKKIYPFIPGFLIRYLERVVHQEEINRLLPRLAGLEGLEFIRVVLEQEVGMSIEVIGQENLPFEGRFIVASNHPLGGLDGLALMHVVGQKRKDLQFITNDILLELKPLAGLFAPVNKHGRNSKEAVATIDALYASDQVVLVFPAGLVSRRQKGHIADLEWKKSFITKAIQHKRDIIPVYIEGRNSDFFYNLANWRKRLRIKTNIEMLYLADELFKQRSKTIRIQFGRQISWKTFTRDLSHAEWAARLRAHVYRLPEGVIDFGVV